ncbi:major capsid protein [Ruficoccus amylovorans]|uniref:Major capsid protein n=1 Tax=Ruficoccus amylovorans TaxID=1804625 RepID=A0A842HB81_9BACT|nr:major capsid protein [Ruficoccus amylovorans]MBC2592691.1 major capsid protein [Ruficoccus amylovorans]
MKSNAVFNPVLSALFNAYFINPGDYVGLDIAPIFRTGEQSANYPVFGRENFVNMPTLKPRAPGTPYPRSVPSLSDDKYSTKNYGHETPVPDENRKKYAKQIDADNAAVKRNAQTILVNHELRVRALVKSAAVTHRATPAAKWDDYANSDPIADVKAARRVIDVEGGIAPNLLTLTPTVVDKLALHPKIRALYPTHNGPITTEMLRVAFEIERVRIAAAKVNTAADGQALSIGYLWGDDIILSVSENSQDLESPNAARTFLWTEESGGDDAGSRIETYREDNIKSDVHRSEHHTDEKLTGPDFIYLLESVLTA